MTNPVTLWYKYMKEKYTASSDKWPKVGCAASFLPGARGASGCSDQDARWKLGGIYGRQVSRAVG
eukprot:12933712-Prorocentrum_lima.AAC.1